MNVLYITGVGPFGGASRSLYETVGMLRGKGINVYFVAAKGSANAYYEEHASDMIVTRGLSRFDNTKYGFYRGHRWLILLRELFHLPFSLVSLVRARIRWNNIDIIHINEITEIIPGMFARLLFRVPLVIHVRSVQRASGSWRCHWISWMLSKANTVIAIDQTVRSSLPPTLPVIVIHNSFTPINTGRIDNTIVKKLEALDNNKFRVGFVGNLLVVKGLFDLLDAAKIVCSISSKVQFLIVGDVARKDKGLKAWALRKFGYAQDIKGELKAKIAAYGLESDFLLLGETTDIQSAYKAFNILCFPSHYDAPGRPIFEAAFSGVPAIAAISCPLSDTLVNGQTGLAVPPKNPRLLAEAILQLAESPLEVERMGKNAQLLARSDFDTLNNANMLLQVYQRLTIESL